MRVNELRIGNWINAYHGNVMVAGLNQNYPEIFTTPNLIGVTHGAIYSPIPLTEEWLIKFGFEQGALGSWKKSITLFGNLRELSFGGDYLYLREGKEVFGSGEDDLCVLWNKDVVKQFHVHQLQNLYFALTGEELTIKE